MVIKNLKVKFYVLLSKKRKMDCTNPVMADLRLNSMHPTTVQGGGSEMRFVWTRKTINDGDAGQFLIELQLELDRGQRTVLVGY